VRIGNTRMYNFHGDAEYKQCFSCPLKRSNVIMLPPKFNCLYTATLNGKHRRQNKRQYAQHRLAVMGNREISDELIRIRWQLDTVLHTC